MMIGSLNNLVPETLNKLSKSQYYILYTPFSVILYFAFSQISNLSKFCIPLHSYISDSQVFIDFLYSCLGPISVLNYFPGIYTTCIASTLSSC